MLPDGSLKGAHAAEGEDRAEKGSSGGLSKAFCFTDEGISCLDFGGLSVCVSVRVVFMLQQNRLCTCLLLNSAHLEHNFFLS